MIIGITISEKNEDSKVDPRFGRAPYFLIYNEKSGEKKIVDNSQNLNAPQGAGIQAAQNILKENIEILLTGNVGPKAFQLLAGANVQIYTEAANLTVDDAVKAFKEGKLPKATDATKPGHW